MWQEWLTKIRIASLSPFQCSVIFKSSSYDLSECAKNESSGPSTDLCSPGRSSSCQAEADLEHPSHVDHKHWCNNDRTSLSKDDLQESMSLVLLRGFRHGTL